MKYSNEFETYEIRKVIESGKITWYIYQDGVMADRSYKRLKDAKAAIDNHEIYF